MRTYFAVRACYLVPGPRVTVVGDNEWGMCKDGSPSIADVVGVEVEVRM